MTNFSYGKLTEKKIGTIEKLVLEGSLMILDLRFTERQLHVSQLDTLMPAALELVFPKNSIMKHS